MAMSFFLNPERKRLKYFSLAALLLLFGLLDHAEAQSGRRTTRTTEPATNPVPSSTPTPEPVKVPQLGGLENKVQLLIGRQRTKRKLQSEDAIFATFVERLSQYINVSSQSIGDLQRAQAVVRAKNETDAFVVVLSFDIDAVQNGTIILNSPDLEVEYRVLAPRTGKELTKGKVYFQSIGGARMRRSGWPPSGTPIKITAEATGIEAAELMHDWFRLREAQQRTPDK
jgi:hypothetical protein